MKHNSYKMIKTSVSSSFWDDQIL